MTSPAQVLAAARHVAPMGYGGMAFISDVAAQMGTTVPALAAVLNRYNREGSIRLQRADLVGAMDAAKVQASEIQHPMLASACFHFVLP